MVCSVCEAAGWLVGGPAGGAAADAAVLLHSQPARCLRSRGLCHSAASIEYDCCWVFAWVHRGLWLALMAGGGAWQRRLAIAAGAARTALTSVAESSHLGHQTGELICPPEQCAPSAGLARAAALGSCNSCQLQLCTCHAQAAQVGSQQHRQHLPLLLVQLLACCRAGCGHFLTV